ncbi:cytoskeletal protein [Cryptosporidium ryanae]|uniref:cytoskeletal protein n=1 Tax=Cryptosporidium ryanae TaxID=515981 RepID=UPI00351A0A30|nr:cytoskeletal protein [Cryptosporidium ryanae]
MEEYDSQSTVEDVSEWAEHIEDVIDELQRNYKIIQTEMSCLVEKLQQVNHKQKSNFSSRRVVIPRRRIGKSYYYPGINNNNENNWNFNPRRTCSNCNMQNQIGCAVLNSKHLSSCNDGALINEEYINELIKKKLASMESSILEKLEKSCNYHHIEFQRNLTDLKIQESITETTVKDIAIQLQDVALEVKEVKRINKENENRDNLNTNLSKTDCENFNNTRGTKIISLNDKKVNNDDVCDKEICYCSSCSSSSSSSSCSSSTSLCSCISCSNSCKNGFSKAVVKLDDIKYEQVENLLRILRDIFVEENDLVGVDNSFNKIELENIMLLRQMFRDSVRIQTQKRLQALEDSIGEIKNKNIKYEKANELILNDMKKLINDELMNRNSDNNKIVNLQNNINNILIDISSIQNEMLDISKNSKEEINQCEKGLNDRINTIEKELISRSELIKEAIRELNSEYKIIKEKQDSESINVFASELLNHIGDKLLNIKELINYISQDLFNNEDKLQKQIKKNSLNIQELKNDCSEFEKHTDNTINEMEISMKEFRTQTISILTSMYEIINKNTDNDSIEHFELKYKEFYEQNNNDIKSEHLLVQPKFFSHPKKSITGNIKNNNYSETVLKGTQEFEKNSDSTLFTTIPPNAYYINKINPN